jgi:alpha-tubulin suppressor-like RCC1 family protein
MLRQRLLLTSCIVAATWTFQSCSGDSPTDTPPDQVAGILFDYPEVASELRNYLVLGELLQLDAQPIDSAGDVVQGVPLTWSSSNQSVLAVSPAGELTGRAVGEAVITVQANGEQASLPFAVLAPVASVEVLPPEIGLVPGGAAEIQFVLKDAGGQLLTARSLTLTTMNSAVAVATQHSGVLEVRAGTAGTTTLGFMREGKSAELDVQVTPVQFDTVDASGGRACGLTSEGTAWCWGTNAQGALGYGIRTISSLEGSGWTPIRVSGGHAFSQISLGNSHTCALTGDGTAYCWGNNATGALGVSDLDFAAAPVPVSGGLRFSQISASYAYTCGVTIGGAAYCWGNNDVGQLGDGTTTQRFAPVPVAGGLTFTRISSRWAEQFAATTCGLTPGGAPYCWGSDFQDQAGAPVPVPGGHTFVSLSAGGSHSCGIDQAGDAYCWGSYGDGDTTPDLVPGGLQWRSINVLAEHSCGVTASNAAYCWGYNGNGQLGDGTITDSGSTPVAVAGGLAFQSVSAAQGYTCGRTLQGVAYCWGEGSSGQLGQNNLEARLSPVPVVGQL